MVARARQRQLTFAPIRLQLQAFERLNQAIILLMGSSDEVRDAIA